MEIKQYGFIPDFPNEKDWEFGGGNIVGDVDVMPDGDWLKVNTKEDAEMQFNRKFDTFSCVTFTCIKATVEYLKQVYNVDEDYSERFIAVMSGTKPGVGNSVRNVLETIRKYGMVLESDFPSITEDMTEEQYFDRDEITPETLKKGLEWLVKWEFNWENVPAILKMFGSSLKKSPLILTGYSWEIDKNGLYNDFNRQANHCFLGVKLEGANMIVNDSYPADSLYDNNSNKAEFIKKLAADYNFWSANRISVKKKAYNPSFISNLKNMINNIWVWFETVGSPKGLRAYYCPTDSKGAVKGRQEIDFDNPSLAIKALFSALNEAGLFKKTSWPEVKGLGEKKFV